MDFFTILGTPEGLLYLLILSLLEIVLGIDNIIFISIITDKLPAEKKRYARNVGMTMALVVRLLLLAVAAWVMGMTSELFSVFGVKITGQSLILLLGGLFLLYKSTTEMHKTVTGEEEESASAKSALSSVIFQIVLVDIVFSFDSVITAIGMTKGMDHNPMIVIYLSVIISMIIMMLFARPISDFINNRPTIKMIALSFLVTIGIMLIMEAFHQEVPKGYVYFAMIYSLIVEFLNIRMRKNKGKTEH
ncbi:MAG: TerC family protein [Bacteroidota bacterium]